LIPYDQATALLRRLGPEDAHGLAVWSLSLGLGPRAGRDDPILATDLAGLQLPNCVGLAAGFDKNAEAVGGLIASGFGFVECGTVTPLPQAGNPRPRLFRLTEDRAVINRMGFNNQGLEAFAGRLERRPRRRGVVGANLGANKESPDRIGDYVTGLERLWRLADYFTVNVSSPNTPGLRALQGRAALDDLFGRLGEARARLTAQDRPRPVFLKVAPDLEPDEPASIVGACLAHGVDGIIVSNTTVERPGTLRSTSRVETGGLSGAPLFEPSTRRLRDFAEAAQGRLVLVGAGGIRTGDDAFAKLRAGASAVQVYTAMIYEGPGLVGRLKRQLAQRLRAEGFRSVAEAVWRP
jgi:dihydroorotate dehydrogenase